MAFMFEQLNVYQKAINLAEMITNATDSIARGNYYLTDQLNRAVLSIATNLAEGNGRWHEKDRKQFFYIARGSAQECVPIIELCKRKKLVSGDQQTAFKTELEEISKMISGLIKGMPERK